MQQLNGVLGASDTRFNHSKPNNPDSSIFPFSRLVNLTADPGQIIPVDCFRTYPGDRATMGIAFSLDTLPLVQAPLTRYKVIFHAFYMKARDLWKGAKTATTKGRSGNVQKTVPKVDLSLPSGSVSYKPYPSGSAYTFSVYALGKHSLSAFIGVPSDISGIYTDTTGNGNFVMKEAYQPYTYVPDDVNYANATAYNNAIDEGFHRFRYFNALPLMMYQSCCRNNYCTPNLLQGSQALFPEQGDDDWILPYNATITNFVGEVDNSNAASFVYNYNGVYSSSDTAVRLDLLRYSLFDDDYFTTGLPWLQRGDVTNTEVNILNDVYIDSSDAVASGSLNATDNVGILDASAGADKQKFVAGNNNNAKANLLLAFNKLKVKANTDMQISLTANKIREVLALSVWQERNARVDGSYNAMIFQHWRVNPHSEEHLPVYMGGTASYVAFSTILQNSATTSSSPLGSTAGMASHQAAGQLCNSFYCEDYGYIMVLMQIKPDTVYQQGVEYFLSRENTFEDMVFPEFQNLGPQPILNKELYVSGTQSDDDDLFAYQEPFTFAKVRYNVNRGLFQVKPDKDRLFASFTQARWFSSKPSLSYQFLCMYPENMRRDWLAYPSYPAFRMSIASNVKLVRKLAYSSQPETFGF